MRLNTLIRRVERLQGELLPAVKEACVKREKWIVAANREQLGEGLNADGVLMNNGEYSPYHLFRRMRRGLPVRHVYLDFEGDLQAGMRVEFGETGFAVVTTDWKQQLVDEAMRTGYWPSSGYNAPEYGPVFGLTAEKKGELARLIAPSVGRRLRRKLLN